MNKYLVFSKHICKELIWGGVVPLLLMLVFSCRMEAQNLDCHPTAAFTSTSPGGCSGTYSFASGSNPANTAHTWDFGDGSPLSTAVNPTWNYFVFNPNTAIGTQFTVTHTIFFGDGTSAQCQQVIHIACGSVTCGNGVGIIVRNATASCLFTLDLQAITGIGGTINQIDFGATLPPFANPILENWSTLGTSQQAMDNNGNLLFQWNPTGGLIPINELPLPIASAAFNLSGQLDLVIC